MLRRRDEPDLRLSRADRDAERAEAFAALGRTFRNLAVQSPKALEDALGDAFPWLEFLPAPDRRAFVEEFSRVVAAAAELDSYAPVVQLTREWRATAEVHADPKLARERSSPAPQHMYFDLAAKCPVREIGEHMYSLMRMEDILFVTKHPAVEQELQALPRTSRQRRVIDRSRA